MDETSSLRPSYLDSLEIDTPHVSSLARVISRSKLANSFSRIRNLRFESLFALKSGWDIILLASQTLTTLDFTSQGGGKFRLDIASHLRYTDTHAKILPDDARAFSDLLKDFPFDLGRLPALRLLKFQLPIWSEHNSFILSFLISLLSISSSPSGIETLDLEIILRGLGSEDEIADLFASGPGSEWDTLDEVLTNSETFASLRKVVLDLSLKVHSRHRNSGYDNLALSYVNDLFPMFKRRDCTLETHVQLHK